jgi:hypothetical protein
MMFKSKRVPRAYGKNFFDIINENENVFNI